MQFEGISFISVQRDLRGDDAALLARQKNVTHVGDTLNDMADTAAVVALADLTVAVERPLFISQARWGARPG